MKTPKTMTDADAGVALVSFIVGKELGWIVRSQPVADVGIDAHIEVVKEEEPTGRLLALQIKTGSSYFDEPTSDGYVFRPERKHVEYWLSHSLPVAVVLVDLDKETAYWQLVTDKTVATTKEGEGKGKKMIIPKANVFAMPAALALAAAAGGDAYTLKLRQLQLARPWMEHLVRGGSLGVELEEWVNKSSGRASLLLTARDEAGAIVDSKKWPWIILPFADYAVELPRMFPWAEFTVPEDAMWDMYEMECGYPIGGFTELLYTMTFEEWLEDQGVGELHPVWCGGEVDRWKLELELSDLGRAFLQLDDLLTHEILHPLFGN